MELFDYQQQFLDEVHDLPEPVRACLYYKTGAGKSVTALLGMKDMYYDEVLVIAPPSTHQQWVDLGLKYGMIVRTMSHAKFRMKETLLNRRMPVIADEFHLFGGQRGQGWVKLDRLAMHLQAPIFLLSATPNYNDAERVYCVQHILDPASCKGGYLQFLYRNCQTEVDPFSMVPKVLGFLNHRDAAHYLSELPHVWYLPDDLVYQIQDVAYDEDIPEELVTLGYNRRKHKMIASLMEQRHAIRYQGLVAEDDHLHGHVFMKLLGFLTPSPVMVYANHSTIAEALARSLDRIGVKYAVVTGDTPHKQKQQIIAEFRAGMHDILIGTATLATGTDGLDRVCDTLVILDDTDDDALRRQLVGRIMPRGAFSNVSDKRVVRFVPVPA